MTFHDLLNSIGLDPTVLYAGWAGGSLRALSRKRIKIREILVSPICGALASAYLTIPVIQYLELTGWPIPDEREKVILASAFLIGTCAMWIADLVFGFIVHRVGITRNTPQG